MLLFKKLRIKSMRASSILKYIAYAIGEIILIVVGINIAIHFDNAKEQENINSELGKVYEIISHDLAHDTTKLGEQIIFFQALVPIYEKILLKEVSKEDMSNSILYQYPAIVYRNLTFHDRGYNLLIGNAEFNSSQNDSLHINLSLYYDFVTNRLENITQKQIRADSETNIEHWKFNYDWYYNMESNPDFVAYALNNPEYLNMVRKHQFLIVMNYLPDLIEYKQKATTLLKKINKKKP